MTEKERKIMRTIAKVVKGSSERAQDYLLGWAEGAAYAVCGPQQAMSTPSGNVRDSA